MQKSLFIFLLALQGVACAQCHRGDMLSEDPSDPSDPPATLTGEWGGRRTCLRDKGIEILSTLTADDTWNLEGGKRTSSWYGNPEWVYYLGLQIKSKPLFNYEGGTFFIEGGNHGGLSPSVRDVGSYDFIDSIEAPSFTQLYSCWYRQTLGSDNRWIQIGKSYAYDHFTIAPHAALFINASYTTIPTIFFLPTYPDPAMAIITKLPFNDTASILLGIYEGSLANGNHTGERGVFGKFFNDLWDHAFIIGELDLSWQLCGELKGQLGLGGWRTTASITQFNGTVQKGSAGPYLTFDQIIFDDKKLQAAFFFLYGWADPKVSANNEYFGTGFTAQGFSCSRPKDTIGIGASTVTFSQEPDSGFIDKASTSYELFYTYNFTPCCYLEPDFQYIVHPGGSGLPNASVFTIRLQLNL